MTNTQSLGDRMREYVDVHNTRLMKRTPVIIQVDGWNFHTFTKGMEKPFCVPLMVAMHEAAKYMCEHIEGAKIAYVQSDEISILLTNYESLNQGAWFDYRTQKLASISASLATVGFNGSVRFGKPAMFDARCFNLDREEVCNWFIWRQQDWTRNSIQMVAQSKFSQKVLHGKDQNEMQEMLFEIYGINWNNYHTDLKRGTCVVKGQDGSWRFDSEIPVFQKNREYINRFVYPKVEVENAL